MAYGYELSPLNTDLESRLRTNLASEGKQFDPMFALQKGEFQDRNVGAYKGVKESIGDRFAGWSRGGGLLQAALSEAEGKQAASLSEGLRGLDITQLGMEADQKNKNIMQSLDYLNLDSKTKQAIMEANLKADLNAANIAADKEKWASLGLLNTSRPSLGTLYGSGVGTSSSPSIPTSAPFTMLGGFGNARDFKAYLGGGGLWNTEAEAIAAMGGKR